METSGEQRGDEERQWGLETRHVSSSRYVVFFLLFFYSINSHLDTYE